LLKSAIGPARGPPGPSVARARSLACVYGGKQDPELVAFDQIVIRKAWRTGTFLRELCQVEIDGKPTRVIPREVQIHPVSDQPLHVDFLRLGKGARLTIEVEVHFLGDAESPGLEQGGALNIVRHTG